MCRLSAMVPLVFSSRGCIARSGSMIGRCARPGAKIPHRRKVGGIVVPSMGSRLPIVRGVEVSCWGWGWVWAGRVQVQVRLSEVPLLQVQMVRWIRPSSAGLQVVVPGWILMGVWIDYWVMISVWPLCPFGAVLLHANKSSVS